MAEMEIMLIQKEKTIQDERKMVQIQLDGIIYPKNFKEVV